MTTDLSISKKFVSQPLKRDENVKMHDKQQNTIFSEIAAHVPTLEQSDTTTRELGQKRKITIYLAGKIPKGEEPSNDELHWTNNHMDLLRSSLSEFEIELLNPAFKDCDLSNQDTVFARDMHYVFSSNVIFVDARGSRGIGVGAEMLWAKVNKIPVISWAPTNTYYNKPEFIHPFVKNLSDQLVDNIEDGATWIKQYVNNPQSLEIKNSDTFHLMMEAFKQSKLLQTDSII